MNLIDTHAHIYAADFKTDQRETLRRAQEEGVTRILMPNIDHTSIDAMLETEAQHPELCLAMMGLHPCSVKKDFQQELYRIEAWLNQRNFIGIGEAGIDLYWDKTFLAQQQEALQVQVDWAVKFRLPLILHTRDSFSETYEIIARNQHENLTGIFHCFSGTAEEAKKAIDLSFYLGIGGVATFKNGGFDKVLPEIPLEKIVLETDCPYLAPVPHRGKRNEPAYVKLVAEKVAQLKNISVEELAEVTTANAKKLFGLK
ncbi:TatD family hydrolase [Adhaeribacter sp. BT258]|uniref:TatD family hydrolase n=1 Tax=Adhaeribacter terrigena TaxID=2793070 RepID=A0ABS1BZN0_9BACT|nr:TatD family hydrolase [Adhaeribacter terrigena]MBK0402594.1 TatD family hydrolase [Adhaeribacter terrigena]